MTLLNHAGSIIIMYDVIIDHGYNPDSHLTMNALITLERRMNVPVLTKLQSNFRNLMKLTGVHAKQVRRQTRYYVGHSLWWLCNSYWILYRLSIRILDDRCTRKLDKQHWECSRANMEELLQGAQRHLTRAWRTCISDQGDLPWWEICSTSRKDYKGSIIIRTFLLSLQQQRQQKIQPSWRLSWFTFGVVPSRLKKWQEDWRAVLPYVRTSFKRYRNQTRKGNNWRNNCSPKLKKWPSLMNSWSCMRKQVSIYLCVIKYHTNVYVHK